MKFINTDENSSKCQTCNHEVSFKKKKLEGMILKYKFKYRNVYYKLLPLGQKILVFHQNIIMYKKRGSRDIEYSDNKMIYTIVPIYRNGGLLTKHYVRYEQSQILLKYNE